MARAEEIRHVEAGDRAAAVPVLQQAAAEDVLTDSLDHQALGFRRSRQVRGFGLEDMKQPVWKRARELERAAQQAMEGGDVADTRRADGAAREQVGEHHTGIVQTLEDVGPRHGGEKPGFSPGREPDAHRRLAAAEGEPVGRVLQFEVEAVVGRGLLQPGDRDGRQHQRPRPSDLRSHATRMLTCSGSGFRRRSSVARSARSSRDAVRYLNSRSNFVRSLSIAALRDSTSVG